MLSESDECGSCDRLRAAVVKAALAHRAEESDSGLNDVFDGANHGSAQLHERTLLRVLA